MEHTAWCFALNGQARCEMMRDLFFSFGDGRDERVLQPSCRFRCAALSVEFRQNDL